MTKEKSMPFLYHLSALRKHLIRASLGVIIAGIVAFIFRGILFDGLLLAPKSPDFISYRVLCLLSEMMCKITSTTKFFWAAQTYRHVNWCKFMKAYIIKLYCMYWGRTTYNSINRRTEKRHGCPSVCPSSAMKERINYFIYIY